ncbi:envelope glycoprotein N [Equid gammaherpesvirus 2]|nr:envelope glycoprotein N [Equid gammaherpesvirus 2]UTM04675.1 envelope glycoprotein N [Equid gammaherpesvirus 2]UTM05456.1 envelope glycoprotein N [Equid gammaherpesvirus 2]UTM05614.1 envelope glycoprotein N [Equid gammaherpesvirus 2]
MAPGRGVLLLICLCLMDDFCQVICKNSTTPSESKTFYSYDCNADTYAPQLASFSTIWTLLNVLVMTIACVIYLIYMCFNKFVATMTNT